MNKLLSSLRSVTSLTLLTLTASSPEPSRQMWVSILKASLPERLEAGLGPKVRRYLPKERKGEGGEGGVRGCDKVF